MELRCNLTQNRRFASRKVILLSEHQPRDVVWQHGSVNREDRADRLGHRGATLWFTGLSGSGKSTIAVALESSLHALGHHAYRLDGDNLRHGLNADLGFSQEDRAENVRRVGEVSALFADSGLLVLSSFISPERAGRELVRKLHMKSGTSFFEIHVDAPLEVAESRDPKGLYAKARAGVVADFTGIHQSYEAPESPDLHLPTGELSVEQSVDRVISMLRQNSVLPTNGSGRTS